MTKNIYISGPILPYFTEALVTGLSYPDDSHFTDAGLKMAVLKGKFEIIFFLKLFGLKMKKTLVFKICTCKDTSNTRLLKA